MAAVGGNVMVLKMFGNYPSLRSPGNTLVVNLAFSDLCLMIALIPEAVINFFSGGPWQFGEIGCQIHAFCGQYYYYTYLNYYIFVMMFLKNIYYRSLFWIQSNIYFDE